MAGCGASSPRFVSHDSSQQSGKPEKKNNGPRFSSKHIEEEKKEDDHKVDVKQVVARFSSAKPALSATPPPVSNPHCGGPALRCEGAGG